MTALRKRAVTGQHAVNMGFRNVLNFFAGHVRLIKWYFVFNITQNQDLAAMTVPKTMKNTPIHLAGFIDSFNKTPLNKRTTTKLSLMNG